MEKEQNARVIVAGFLTDRLKEIWRNFMEEFQQSFDLDQLDLVFSVLKELESSSQNPAKRRRIQFMQKGEKNNNNNSNSSSMEKKVFGSHVLAKSVFEYLSNSDILACRLINSYWNDYATEILLKRDFKISFTRRDGTNRFYQQGESSENASNWRTLDMFTQLLRTSKNFPCNKFAFWGGNLGNDDAQRFFSFYGSSIKSIEILLYDENQEDVDKSEDGFSVAVTDSRVIGMVLSQQLLNLEHLKLYFEEDEIDWAGFKSLLFPPCKQVVLHNLKTVVYNGCDGDRDFLRQLLIASSNLKTFEMDEKYFDMGYVDLFIETGKVKTMYDLNFSPKSDLNKLEKMAEHGPELKGLCLSDLFSVYKNPELWRKISTVLTKFLSSSQKSLNQLKSFYSLGFLRELQLPVLENVTELYLKVMKSSSFNPQDVHDYSFAFFPRGATFSGNFPILKSVTLCFVSEISSEDAAAWWKKCFPTDEIVLTVKKLDISKYLQYSCPLSWMEKLGRTFPNLEELSVKKVKDFPSFSKIIWNSCTKLKSLALGIDLSSPLNAYPALDSSFTGISPEVCKTLEKQSLFYLERMGDNFRDNPSILSLKDLQTLEITFRDNSQENQQPDCKNFLTQISGPCAFNLLETLKSVNIYVYGVQDQNALSRIKKFLEPLKAYKVNIK